MCVCFFIFYSYSYLIRAGYVVYPRLRIRPATLRGAFLVTFPPVKYLGIILQSGRNLLFDRSFLSVRHSLEVVRPPPEFGPLSSAP